MKVISILDTTISDYNLGNQIIMEAVNDILDDLFWDDFMFRLQYAERFGGQSLRHMRHSDYIFWGGTNALTSHMNKYKQMGFALKDLLFVKDLILLGVGWWQYQGKPNLYTRLFLRRLLSSERIHSVRDSYTEGMLKSIGIENVVNTSCPTVWGITGEHCRRIPTLKGKNVLTTTTDYAKNAPLDEKLINILLSHYDYVYYWIQGVGDLDYINRMHIAERSRVKIISPKLKAYDRILESADLDYIGTRLHAGIRAIQKRKRALILGVDNRAEQISKDIGLNVSPRGDFVAIERFIESEYATELTIPMENIAQWKAQFKD